MIEFNNFYKKLLSALAFALLTLLAGLTSNAAQIQSVSNLERSPAELIDQQITAYNEHDIATFLTYFHNDIEVYEFPNKLLFKGKSALKKTYLATFNTHQPSAVVLKRIVHGNKVIDHERVISVNHGNKKVIKGIAMYEVEGQFITKMMLVE